MGYLEDLEKQYQEAMKSYNLVLEFKGLENELRAIRDELAQCREVGNAKARRDEDLTEDDWAKTNALTTRHTLVKQKLDALVKQHMQR